MGGGRDASDSEQRLLVLIQYYYNYSTICNPALLTPFGLTRDAI